MIISTMGYWDRLVVVSGIGYNQPYPTDYGKDQFILYTHTHTHTHALGDKMATHSSPWTEEPGALRVGHNLVTEQ